MDEWKRHAAACLHVEVVARVAVLVTVTRFAWLAILGGIVVMSVVSISIVVALAILIAAVLVVVLVVILIRCSSIGPSRTLYTLLVKIMLFLFPIYIHSRYIVPWPAPGIVAVL